MKVLKVIHTLGHGGAENTFRWLSSGLQRRGVEVIAAIPSTANPEAENWVAVVLEQAGIAYVTFNVSGRPWHLLKNLAAVVDLVDPDLVHSHLLDSNFYTALVCGLKSIPHVCTEHGDVSLKKSLVSRMKYAAISRISRRIICVSEAVRVRAINVISARRKLVAIYNGIRFLEKNESTFRAEYNISDDSVLIGNVGNLYPVKGQRYLLRAFADIYKIFPKSVLVLVGRGSEEEQLKRQVRDLNLPQDSVVFTGFRDDIENVMNSFDLYVQPSISEGHPLAVLEAMSLGLPVVASAVGGIPEITKQEQYGTLVKPGEVDELRSIIHAFMQNPERFIRKAAGAQIFVREEFSIERMVDSYLNCYQEVLR